MMTKIKRALYDQFYVNGEFSQTRLFLAILFVLSVIGILGIYFDMITPKEDVKDLIKWMLSWIFGEKIADKATKRIFESPNGVPTGPKNPRGDDASV